MQRWIVILVAATLVYGCGETEPAEAVGNLNSDATSDTFQADTGARVVADTETPETTSDTRNSNLACSTEAAVGCREQGKACQLIDDTTACFTCPLGEYPNGDAQCVGIPGTVLSHDRRVDARVSQELNGWCQQWRLGNTEPVWVNAVEFMTDGGYHHSNWFCARRFRRR